MGGGFSQIGATCIMSVAQLSANDFFLNLSVKDTSTGPEYWIGSQQITKFPRELAVSVLIADIGTCSHSEIATSSPPETLLQDLRWNVAWKTGMKTRPASGIDITQAKSSPEEEIAKRTGIPFALSPSSGPRQAKPRAAWTITIRLHEQDAPLTDSLIVTATTNTGKQVARFSAHL